MIYFIVNPTSGSGDGKKAVNIIKEIMESKEIKYIVEETKYPNHASGLVENALKNNNVKKIIAVGGDGTILEVIAGMTKTKIPLGVIPVGTGNDVAKTLNLPEGLKNINKSLDISLYGVNFESDLIDYYNQKFLNIASIGIDAEIVDYASKLKKNFHGLAYFFSILKNIVTYKAINATLEFDNKIIENKFILIAVANGKFYGGGFKIAPDAKMNSGKIKLVTVEKIPNLGMLLVFPTVLFGKHTFLKQVKMYDVEEITIRTKEKCIINIDGNIYNNEGIHSFKINKKAINIMVSEEFKNKFL